MASEAIIAQQIVDSTTDSRTIIVGAGFVWDDANKRLGIGASSPLSKLHVSGTANEIKTIFQGGTSQTANISEWRNSSGTVIASIASTGALAINSATAAQAKFFGWSAGGANVNHGQIQLGNAANDHLRIRYEYDGGSGYDTYIENMSNLADSDIVFRTRVSGTAVEGLRIKGTGEISFPRPITFTGATGPQAWFWGWDSSTGQAGYNGEIRLGSNATSCLKIRQSYDGGSGFDSVIENMHDSAESDMVLRTRGSGTPLVGIRITGGGDVRITNGATQKIGLWGASPVVQPSAIANAVSEADAVTKLNDLLAKLRTIGVIAT
jgi:hypothetical protein